MATSWEIPAWSSAVRIDGGLISSGRWKPTKNPAIASPKVVTTTVIQAIRAAVSQAPRSVVACGRHLVAASVR
jgi:hypothetical protein